MNEKTKTMNIREEKKRYLQNYTEIYKYKERKESERKLFQQEETNKRPTIGKKVTNRQTKTVIEIF